MTYLYECHFCREEFEIIKPVSEFDRQEVCPSCGTFGTKVFGRVQLVNTAVQEKFYSHALGKVVTKREQAAIAKAKGWEEHGNRNDNPPQHKPEQKYDYD